jgi:hypothetical protein
MDQDGQPAPNVNTRLLYASHFEPENLRYIGRTILEPKQPDT